MQKTYNTRLTLTPAAVKSMRTMLSFFSDEISRGLVTVLPGGNVQYDFDADEEKTKIWRQCYWQGIINSQKPHICN